VGAHDVGAGDPGGGAASTGVQRASRLRTVLVAAASITWLFTLICLIGVIADGDSDGRLGFVILGVPFLAAALACTYGARTIATGEQLGAGAIIRAAHGESTSLSIAPTAELDFNNLPGGTMSTLEAMRRSYADLDTKLDGDERDTEAWQTMTQIMQSIIPTTVATYRRVAGDNDADAEFARAVRLLSATFAERRAIVTGHMVDRLRAETRYIEDRFKPSDLTVDDATDEPRSDSSR
jgi:hypothetical protein